MNISQLASQLRVLFEKKITNYYRSLYKGSFGKVQNEVLDYLSQYGECRTQDVANDVFIPKQHASKIILRLVELDLVEGKKDENDKRAVVYYLSEKGRNLVQEHIKDSNAHFEKKLEKLTIDEKEKLMDAMKTMISLLKKL